LQTDRYRLITLAQYELKAVIAGGCEKVKFPIELSVSVTVSADVVGAATDHCVTSAMHLYMLLFSN